MVRSLTFVFSLVVVAAMATESFAQGTGCCGSQAVVSTGCGEQACCGKSTRTRLFAGRFSRSNRNCYASTCAQPVNNCCSTPVQVVATPCVSAPVSMACNSCCNRGCNTGCNSGCGQATYTSYNPGASYGSTPCNSCNTSCNSCNTCGSSRVRLFNRGNCCGGCNHVSTACGGCGAVSGGCAGCGTPSPAATISAPIESSQAVPPVPTEGN